LNEKHPAIYFEIPVIDLERAMQFYSTVFHTNFEIIKVHDSEMALFPLSKNQPGISGALAKGPIYKPSLTGTLLYFHTDSIQETLQSAVACGAEVLFPITKSGDWGWVAEFKDSEGNRIALHQTF